MPHPFGGRGEWRAAAAAGTGPSARFVSDVNLSDRSAVPTGATLVKRWLVSNDGAVAWPAGSKLIFIRGDRELADAEETPVPLAQPGQTVEIATLLRVPNTPGRYQAYFRLTNADRMPFGQRMWVDLMAANDAPAVDDAGSKQQSSETQPEAQPQQQVESEPVVNVLAPAESAPSQASSSPAPASSASATPAVAASSPYESQLSLLSEMGFSNRELNSFLLESRNGDVRAVAAWLLDKMKNDQ